MTQQTLRFTGSRALLPLVLPTDTADLDDMLLVFSVAAKKLTRSKQSDAPMMVQEAARRLQWTKQQYPTTDKRRVLGGGVAEEFRNDRRLVGMLIAVAGGGQGSQIGAIQQEEGGVVGGPITP